ncbi:MAG: transcriptional regulator [Elusimicrobiota bacterium]|nr:transcriptional regulator [Elusimicrobiota bacterium]
MKNTVSYDSYMKKVLVNRDEAAAYINAAAEGGELKYLLVAIRRVVGANGGMGALAKATKMSRTTLYKTLSPTGNPEVGTLQGILAVYGIRLAFLPVESPRPNQKHTTSHGHHISPQ